MLKEGIQVWTKLEFRIIYHLKETRLSSSLIRLSFKMFKKKVEFGVFEFDCSDLIF